VSKRYVLSEYVELAMGQTLYDKLEDNSFSGRIPSCPGVLSFAPTLKECEEELRSTLEDWVLVGLKLRHHLPVRRAVLGSSPSVFDPKRKSPNNSIK
jgi:predicted RNase H-like HicB family nuclease